MFFRLLQFFVASATLLITMRFSPVLLASSQTFDPTAIDRYVQATMRADRVPAVALTIVHKDQIVYEQGYGEDGNGRPVSSTTGFILGSMSKSFTALAVMQLVERGDIELDSPVQRYLPWFRVADARASETITIRHLLTHTSGIPTRAPQASGDQTAIQDHVRALATVQISNAPGAKHEYASPNYLVLGAIIEQVSGQSYASYIEQQIFTPLKMQKSFTDQQRAIEQGMARGHRYWFGFPIAATLDYEADRMPTAAVISSAKDLGHFLIAQINQGRFEDHTLLSPAGVAQMHAPAAPGDGFSYGFGWRIGPIKGVEAIHHGGIVPHFRGKMVLLPRDGWGVVVLTNASTSFPLPIMPTSHRMADAIAASLAGHALVEDSYNQSMVYLAITIGLLLVLANQLVGLIRLRQWHTSVATRRQTRVWIEIALELAWPLLALIALPSLIGLPWSEILRSIPDMGIWVITSMSLGLITGVAKAFAFYRTARAGHELVA